ncbi:hypothetical protein Hanom_Chr02g00135751 [Helianthus anomalus]
MTGCDVIGGCPSDYVALSIAILSFLLCGRRPLCQEEVNVCAKKTWVIVCVVKRSRRPFLMKGLRENKQAAASKRLRASARRKHKWPEVLLAKKQTPP